MYGKRAISVLLLTLPVSLPAVAEQAPYDEGEQIAKIDCRDLRESSGIASSNLSNDVFWTHNDSGDKPRLFAINRNGLLLATCPVKNATAVDWEDMASATIDGKPLLIIADCGNNQALRKEIQLYLVPEVLPTANSNKKRKKNGKSLEHELKAARKIRVQFSDGPHDCESLAYASTTKEIFLLTKSWRSTCKMYSLTLPPKGLQKVITAKPFAVLELAGVTSMDITPDDREAIVLTYGHAYLFKRNVGETWTETFRREPTEVELPARRQGEAVCFERGTNSLLLTDERSPCPLIYVKRKN